VAQASPVFSRRTDRGPQPLWQLLLLDDAVFAIDPTEHLTELYHNQWTTDDGAPSNICAIAQTSDGYLWLGSTTGLYRFDGVRFDRFQRPQDGRPLSGDVFRSLRDLKRSALDRNETGWRFCAQRRPTQAIWRARGSAEPYHLQLCDSRRRQPVGAALDRSVSAREGPLATNRQGLGLSGDDWVRAVCRPARHALVTQRSRHNCVWLLRYFGVSTSSSLPIA
jgi:hypothetical protein